MTSMNVLIRELVTDGEEKIVRIPLALELPFVREDAQTSRIVFLDAL